MYLGDMKATLQRLVLTLKSQCTLLNLVVVLYMRVYIYEQVLKPGGVLVMVGHGPDNVSIPASSTIAREIEIRGSFRYKNT